MTLLEIEHLDMRLSFRILHRTDSQWYLSDIAMTHVAIYFPVILSLRNFKDVTDDHYFWVEDIGHRRGVYI